METKKKRERHSAAFKAKVAVEAIKEKETLQELASRFKVSAVTISKWKSEFLSNSALAFSGDADAAKNFQRMVVRRLQELETGNLNPETGTLEPNYQLIFATSNIADELNAPAYTIGEEYSQSNKSLKNI